MFAVTRELAEKVRELDRMVGSHDEHIRTLIDAIQKLMTPQPECRSKRRIGFTI